MNLTCSNDIVWSPMDKGALLVRPADGTAWTLNAPAAFLWSFIESTPSVAHLSNAAVNVLGWSRARAEHEVRAFIDALNVHQLIVAAPIAPVHSSHVSWSCAMALGDASPLIQLRTLGTNARRRPSPRGNSSPG
ncbi:MAG: PqqD family protein [Planctomycetota bacterium]